MMVYPRDMVGYGAKPPALNFPNKAKIAVQFVVNYEEGGENNILHGDKGSEAFLSEIIGAESWIAQRHMNMESIYEYGARAGFWRVLELFKAYKMPVTAFAIATALQRSPLQTKAMIEAGWEMATHGLKWINYRDFSYDEERAHIEAAVRLHEQCTGTKPLGIYQGRTSEHTVQITKDMGCFLYSADSYADDVPYWSDGQIMMPYTLDANDMRFATNQGFNTGEQFYTYLKDSFDCLYAEGGKMMSVGLHLRLVGRPGRFQALKKFVDYVTSHQDVWVATRADIATHFAREIPDEKMNKPAFIARFSDIYEHTPQIAERVYGYSGNLHEAMSEAMNAMTRDEKLALIRAHPDLAGKLAVLTPDSAKEQQGAGLDRLSPAEFSRFTALNDAYKTKFGFPFIFAVKGKTKDDILKSFETRIHHDAESEFAECLRQIDKIAGFRLEARQ